MRGFQGGLRLGSLILFSLVSPHAVRAQAIDPAPAAHDALAAASSIPLSGSTEAGAVRLLAFSVPASGSSAVAQAQSFLATYGAVLGSSGADLDLVVRRVEKSPGPIQIVSFTQRYRSVPVFGGGVRIGIESSPATGASRVIFAAGALLPDPALAAGLDERPSLSPDTCVAAARGHLDRPGAPALAEPKLMVYDAALAGGAPGTHLVWAVTLGDGTPTQVLCDAHAGNIVFQRPFAEEALDLWLGLQFPNPSHWFLGDESGLTQSGQTFAEAKLEWNYAHQIYNFFAGNFSWRGTTGKDNELQLLIESDNTQFYHDPFGEAIQIETGWSSLDVTAHEFAHGIIHHSSDLNYSKASGALNEGYADTMGMFIDSQDWLLGEDRIGFTPNQIVRNYQDPPKKCYGAPYNICQPDQMSEYFVTNLDNGGVHFNSGILNKAHYLMATGDAFNGRPAFPGVAMGRTRMGTLAFHVMRALSSSATFQDARAMSVLLAQTLANWNVSGFVQSDVCAVKNAFAAVEIGSGDFNCDGVDDNFQDPDGDFVPSSIDNCPVVWNPDQKNWDNDADGDACDNDFDNDKRPNGADNCFSVPNWDQANNDKTPYGGCGADGLGDECDADDDNDGWLDGNDNCPFDCNPGQEDGNGANGGDACDPDTDGDGAFESSGDNCPCVYNPGQTDGDGDAIGDACDLCPATFDTPNAYMADWQCNAPRPVQADSDEDGIGDACDALGFGEVAFDLNGAPYDPTRMPAPGGGAVNGSLAGPGGSSFRIPVPLCDTSAAGGANPLDLVEIVFSNLDPTVGVRLVDDDGLVLGSVRPGPAGFDARGVRVAPDCARRYFLDVALDATFGGSDEFRLGSFVVLDPDSPNPWITPGMGLEPAPPVPDLDGDGLPDAIDSCPDIPDPTGADADDDGIGDVCDSCSVASPGAIVGVELNPQPFPPGGGPAGTLISWSADPLADSYDVVYGDLGALHGGAGFTSAVLGCLAENQTGTSLATGLVPLPGRTLFFLVRGNDCAGPGTWDEGAGQSAPRDPQIDASAASCSP